MKMHGVSFYSTLLRDSSFYADVVASANMAYGDVNHKLKGNRSHLKANLYSGSIEMGKSFALGNGGFSLIPQAQLSHQMLDFKATRDQGGFVVDLGKHDQTLLRLGTTIKWDMPKLKKSHLVLNGKVNYLKSLKGTDSIYLGQDFATGNYGDHLQTGFGMTASVAKNMHFYADAASSQRVGKAGYGGYSYNVGINARF